MRDVVFTEVAPLTDTSLEPAIDAYLYTKPMHFSTRSPRVNIHGHVTRS